MKLIDKIQRQLDDNHYVEKEDIQKLIDAQKWIPVEDRLPEEKQRVLVYVRNGYLERSFIDAKAYYYDDEWRNIGNCIVTHWKPLPEPPTV